MRQYLSAHIETNNTDYRHASTNHVRLPGLRPGDRLPVAGTMGAARHGQGGGPPPWKCANWYLQPQSGISNCICCRPK